MTGKEKHCDVFISGGGVPGLTLALLVAELGLSVVVADPQRPNPDSIDKPDGRTAALMAGSVNILKATGHWDGVAHRGAALETLRIVEDKKTQADFHAADIGLPYFGINMPNAPLRVALFTAAEQHENITLLCPDRIQSAEADDVGITLSTSGGKSFRARLLAGADGRSSQTRALCGIDVRERDYGQKAITCVFSHSKPHQGISTEIHRSGGPFTMVPLPGDQSSVVWVEYAADADAFTALRKQDFTQALQDRTNGLVGKIELVTSPESWPLKAMQAKSFIAPRTALMAEAAHVLHPLGAQGLNLSLRDAATLAEEITDAARRGLDIGSATVLNRYQHRRKADIFSRLIGTDSLNRMVSNNIGLLKVLRSAGLKTIESIEPLRRFAMQEGVMPGYDDSRLSRGEAL